MIFKWKLNRTLIFGIFLTFGILLSCSNATHHNQHAQTFSGNSRLDIIIERGKLIAATPLGVSSYFLYRGEPMGYQYELLKEFAASLGVTLEIHIESDPDNAIERLNEGVYDVVAMNLMITRERSKIVDFSLPISQTRQVLVQRKPENWRKMKTMDDVEKHLIRNSVELKEKTVHVGSNSSHYYRLLHLQQEIGGNIRILKLPGKNPEDLLQMVAKGEIDFTICDETLSKIGQKYYPELDVQTQVSLAQDVGWAVGKGNETLLSKLNHWWTEFEKTTHARLLSDRYINNPRGIHPGQRDYFAHKGNNLSAYDDMIKRYSAYVNWDWRLLAALIYQESNFRNDVVSRAGAFGIMQMMPQTASIYGVDSTSAPKEQIAAGVKFIRWIDHELKKEISDPTERQKFVLAAYNVGLAHVYDARRLAAKNNKNPNVWSGNVDYYLRNKSKAAYYSDSVVRYGYCRGEEPYKFVNEILSRYDHYKKALND